MNYKSGIILSVMMGVFVSTASIYILFFKKPHQTIEYPAVVISIESYDEELNTYTIRGLNKVETEFRDQCGRHLLNDTVRVETVTK